MKNLLSQVTFESARRKKDKSVSLSFTTQLEQSSDEFMQMDKLLNDSGVLFFKSSGNLTAEEVKELEAVEIEVEGKTKSQRLRAVLFIKWSQSDEEGEFAEFYSKRMEQYIQHEKDQLTQD